MTPERFEEMWAAYTTELIESGQRDAADTMVGIVVYGPPETNGFGLYPDFDAVLPDGRTA